MGCKGLVHVCQAEGGREEAERRGDTTENRLGKPDWDSKIKERARKQQHLAATHRLNSYGSSKSGKIHFNTSCVIYHHLILGESTKTNVTYCT